MAKVGRASRNASLMRVETISGTKAIGAAESGEIFLVSAACAVSLPPAKAGAYCKFIVSADITSATALVITSTPGQDMAGAVSRVVEAGTGHAADNADVAQAAAADGHDKITIGAGAAVLHPGSWVECVSDGSYWYLTGQVWGSTNAVIVTFATQ